VPAVYIANVRPGSPVTAHRSRGSPPTRSPVASTALNAQVDAATRQVKVYVRVPNPGTAWWAGCSASGAVAEPGGSPCRAIAIPSAGLRAEGDRSW